MRRLTTCLLITILCLSFCLAAAARKGNVNTAQARAARKVGKKQQKAQRKFVKAQRKAQRKMEKYDRKHTHDPNRPR